MGSCSDTIDGFWSLIKRGIIGLFVVLMLVTGYSLAQPQPQETPRIEAKEQAKKTVPPEQDSKAKVSPIIPAAPTTNIESTNHAKNAGDEGTEFWPPFYGYRLKITDTLLVVFTALLFAATVFLYKATRDLVKGAEDTARTELRAYVSVEVKAY